MTTLVVVLGDQLTPDLASLTASDKATSVVLMMEVAEETTYVKHHKKKIALILSAMRHFAADLEGDGWRVDYVRLDDPANTGSFSGEVARAAQRHGHAHHCGRSRANGASTGDARLGGRRPAYRSRSSTTTASSARAMRSPPGPRAASR